MSADPAPALRRGLAVLSLLASRPAPVSAAAVARDLGLPRSSTYELLTELAAAGFAVHLPDQRRWGLGVSAFEIGSAYTRGDPLPRLAGAGLRRLARLTGGTAHLGVLHGPETVYLVKERPPTGGPTLITEVGVRLPASLTATGLSVLAALPAAQARAVFGESGSLQLRTGRGPRNLIQLRAELAAVRRRGWAVEDGRITAGTASVAGAVLDHRGLPVAAVGVTVQHDCPDGNCVDPFADLAHHVRAAAGELSRALGGPGKG